MSLIYLYSHDGEGLGHLRRNLNIALSVTRKLPGSSCLMLTGSSFPGAFGIPERCDFVKIPTLEKNGDNQYKSPLGTLSSPAAQSLRETVLESVVRQVPPDLLIVDKHPQGLNGELLPALNWIRKHSPKTRVILGLRDILDDPKRVEQEWRDTGTSRVLNEIYDRIWMYTDGRIFPTADVYDFEPALKGKGKECGYVVQRTLESPVRPNGCMNVVATVGGGRDGFDILDGSMRAIDRLRTGFPALRLQVYTGPLMPEPQFLRIRALAELMGGWVKVDRFSSRYLKRLRRACAVVTMGGYNSVLECVAMGKATVVVPRESPRAEQIIRARVFEEFGFVRMVRQPGLAGGQLEETLCEILEARWAPAPRSGINLRGFRQILHDIGATLN